ncbi:MAG: hypothetical protein ISS70_02080 [Phycisphaerae bacterium]|nr:hypothetical protein [Phycisphaerae bacterium]
MKRSKQPAKRLLNFALCILIFDSLVCPAAELFSSQQQKDAFLRVLSKQDERYDPAEQMIRRPFSSPGYHTTLKGGYVHPTRDSLDYAVALLDSGQPDRLKRAEQILRRVISLQDQDPENRTYGIWSWFAEEPLDKMSPPDWNWADFCGTQLLQVAIDHMDRLDADLQRQIRESILHAGRAIKRRNVGPGYTNIAVMGAYVTLVAGEHFDTQELADYGKARLKRFYDHTFSQGSFSEYNSPTYSIVAITELARMLRHVKNAESRKLLRELNRFAWSHVARHFHAPTGQWAGPHSRCYATLLRDSTRAYIQRAAHGQVSFLPESAALESLNAHRLGARCPPDLLDYFTSLGEPRVETEAFAKNSPDTHDIIGTTYLHPDYTLGSVNIGDLWNQRRPLLAYWQTEAGVVAMRLRCLHDDYDYSSAGIFAVQDQGDILGAVVFATDGGDTHISLDRIKNATIKAKDLRLRLQFEGAIDNLKLPARPRLNQPIRISSGPVNVDLQIPHAVFADYPVSTETTRTAIDVVLYRGPEKSINFKNIGEAAVIFALTVSTGQDQIENNQLSITNNQSTMLADFSRGGRPRMLLAVPANPLATKDQRKAASAKLNSTNPWKISAPHRP